MEENNQTINNPADTMSQAEEAEQLSESLCRYEKNYSEERLRDKLLKVGKSAGAGVIYPVLLLFFTLKSPEISLKQKSIILGALGYFILPVDLIPDMIPVQGFADDATALMAALQAISGAITPKIKQDARQKLHDWMGDFNETIVNGIDKLI